MPSYSTFRFSAEDGTSLLGWTNDGEGPAIIVCNGLGVPAEGWPRLLDPDCGYRVFGYNHRGSMGSDRPRDLDRIRIDDHVGDAFRLMDEVGVERAIFVAWSYGVNISFEVAKRAPERVAGLVMVCGVPGGTLDSAFAPLMVPRVLRRPLSLIASKTGELLAPEINLFARLLPKNDITAGIARHTGIIMPTAKHEDIIPWMAAFAEHDFAWYFRMFPPAGEHERIDPSFVTVPTTVATGGLDTLTSMLDVVAFAKQIEHAEVHVLHGTHFLPLEYPDEIMTMIDGVLAKSDLVKEQVVDTREAIIDLRTVRGTQVFEHAVRDASGAAV
ncbi:MAG: alpha/beta hydrolase [Actinomycetes bacterium]